MAAGAATRVIGDLTSPDISKALRETSILCLPLGAIEQHGPHLPFNTDAIIAEEVTRRIVARWAADFDLWQLPTVSLGLSREHEWAAGTQSLSVAAFTALIRDLGQTIVRSVPARNLVIVNGHGGNRGILEAMCRELRADFGINLCALHLGALISPVTGAAVPEIHAGRDETSVMLAVAPELVRSDALARLAQPPDGEAIRAVILDPAVSWPWSSDDRRLSDLGTIGDARAASAEHGHAIVERVVEAAAGVLRRLVDNQKL